MPRVSGCDRFVPFLVKVLVGVFTLTLFSARARAMCADQVRVRLGSASSLFTGLLQGGNLNRLVAVRVRLTATDPLDVSVPGLQHRLRNHFDVTLRWVDAGSDGETRTVDVLFEGPARDVGQAVLELCRPEIGGAFAAHPVRPVHVDEPKAQTLKAAKAVPVASAQAKAMARLSFRALDLTDSTFDMLKRFEGRFIGDLLSETKAVESLPHFGPKKQQNLKEALAKLGLTYGVPVRGWPFTDITPTERELVALDAFYAQFNLETYMLSGESQPDLFFREARYGPSPTEPVVVMKIGGLPAFLLVDLDVFKMTPAVNLRRAFSVALAREPIPELLESIREWQGGVDHLQRLSIARLTEASAPRTLAQLMRNNAAALLDPPASLVHARPVVLVPLRTSAQAMSAREDFRQ